MTLSLFRLTERDLAVYSIDVDTLEIAGYDHFGGGLQRQKPARTRTDHYKT